MSTAAVIVLAHSSAFRLGRAEVRPATRELIGPERREVVEPRVMQVLVALARAGGEILSRDDLIACCWEGRIVSENAIDRAISKVRHLGESVADGSFRVETITKVGYRLLADVRTESPSLAALRAGKAIDRRTLVGGALAVALGGAALWLGLRSAGPDVPPEAERLYERGVEAMRYGEAEEVAQAVSALRQAVAIAPDYADGWGMLAVAYRYSLRFSPPEATDQVHERARSAARRALELEPGNVAGLAAQALAVPIYGNWAVAEAAHRQVLERERRQPDVSLSLSRLLANVGRTRESLAILEAVATPIRSLPRPRCGLAWLLWSAGRLEESDRLVDQTLAEAPRYYVAWFLRFWLYAFTGRAAQALAFSGDVAGRPLGIPERDFALIETAARAILSRSPAEIDATVEANIAAAPLGSGFTQNAIQVASYLGQLDAAFAAAEAFYLGRGFAVASARFTPQQGAFTPPDYRRTDFLFAPACRRLRSDPRFARLVEEIGLADYWRRAGTRADAYPLTRGRRT